MADAVAPEDSSTPVSGDIVLGLHWTPAETNPRRRSCAQADLDALCELRDAGGRLMEVVGPGRLCSCNGSVMHTGDSRSGASHWDDERIFVFVDALPPQVASITFTVASSSGEPFAGVPGASCHVSDRVTEDRLISVQLTALGAATERVIARLQRSSDGWRLVSSPRLLPTPAPSSCGWRAGSWRAG